MILFFANQYSSLPLFHNSIGNAWNEGRQKLPIDFRKLKNFEV